MHGRGAERRAPRRRAAGDSALLQFAIAGLKNGAIYALVALGFTIVYAATDAINFAQGEFYMLGGMFGVFCSRGSGCRCLLAALVAVAAHAPASAWSSSSSPSGRGGTPTRSPSSSSPSAARVLLSSLARHVFGPDELSLPAVHAGAVARRSSGRPSSARRCGCGGPRARGRVALSVLLTADDVSGARCAPRRSTATRRASWASTRARLVTVSFALAAALGALAGVAVDAAHADRVRRRRERSASRASPPRSSAVSATRWRPSPAGSLLGLLESMSVAFISSTYKDAIALVVLLLVLFVRPVRSVRRHARARRCEHGCAGRRAGARVDAECGRPSLAAAVLAVPLVVTDTYLLKVLTFVGINVIVVVGLSLLFGYAGQISLGHAAFFGLGAYTCGVLTTHHGWPWRGRRRGRSRAVGARRASARAADAAPEGPLPGHGDARLRRDHGRSPSARLRLDHRRPSTASRASRSRRSAAGSCRRPPANYLLVAAVVVASTRSRPTWCASRPGRALRALHGSEAGARACGVDVSRAKVQVFAVSAGWRVSRARCTRTSSASSRRSTSALGLSIMLVAMVALGGMGSLAGAVVAARC